MSPLPSRSWLQFSARTLLVLIAIVAVCLAWIQWNSQQVRDRKRLSSYLKRGAGFAEPFGLDERTQAIQQFPVMWRWLGGLPEVADIELPRHLFTEPERRYMQTLYPEVQVKFVDQAPFQTFTIEDLESIEARWND